MKRTSISTVFATLALATGCSGGSAGPCTEGATRCSGTTIQTCTDGAFATTADCAASGGVCALSPSDRSAQCAAAPTPECEVGAQGCLVDVQRECGASGWTEVTDCALDGQTCVQLSDTASACLAQCQEGAQRCVPDDNAVQSCVQGAWVETDRCTVADRLCIPSSFETAECRRDCDEDALRCAGDAIEICHFVWTPSALCGPDQICRDDGTNIACLDRQCESGDTRCDGALRQRCVDERWETEVDCASELGADGVCRPAAAGGLECAVRECDGAVQRCSDNAVQSCTNGFWSAPAACGAQICVAAGDAASCKTRECDDGQTRCAAGGLESCVGGFWAAAIGCGTGNGCHVGADNKAACAPLECDAGVTRCQGTSSVEACDGGFWAVTATCSGGESCLQPSGGAAGCAVPCESGAERCGATGVETCGADRVWAVSETCSDSCATITCGEGAACLGGSGCVDGCTGDGGCASGDCLPFYGACRPADKLALCEPCTSDAQCGLFGDACIDIYAENSPVERACSTACGTSADCPRAFSCDGGQCRPVDGLVAYHTCAAIRDTLAEKSCIPGLDQCGLAGVTDGTCNLGTCTLGCFDDTDCPEGTTCQGGTLKFCKVGG